MKYLSFAVLLFGASFTNIAIADAQTQKNYLQLQQQIQQLKTQNNAQLEKVKSSMEAQIAQMQQQIKELNALNKKNTAALKASFDAQIQQLQKTSWEKIKELKQQLDRALSQIK